MNTFERLIEIFKDIVTDTDIDFDSITMDSRIVEDLGMNSIGIMYMVMAIEQEFDVIMHNSSIESFKTLKDVVTFIEEN